MSCHNHIAKSEIHSGQMYSSNFLIASISTGKKPSDLAVKNRQAFCSCQAATVPLLFWTLIFPMSFVTDSCTMEVDKPVLSGSWFSEVSSVCPGQSFSLEIKEVLHHEHSGFQDVLVLDRLVIPSYRSFWFQKVDVFIAKPMDEFWCWMEWFKWLSAMNLPIRKCWHISLCFLIHIPQR